MKLTKIIGFNVMKGYCILKNNIFYRSRNLYSTSKVYTVRNNNLNNCAIFFNKRLLHNEDDNELSNDIDHVYNELCEQPQSIKHILYTDVTDKLMKKLNNCVSLQDILDFLKCYYHELSTEHITQTILVLWDIQKMFYHISLSNSSSYIDVSKFDQLSENYINTLKEDEICKTLWRLLETKQADFNIEQLSYILLYLSKMGISSKENLMQILIHNFQRKFKDDSSLSALARFMTAIYSKNDLSFYYHIQDFVPIVIDSIGRCKNIEELHAITLCLNHMNLFMLNNTLKEYRKKVTEFLKTNVINSKKYKVILSIVMLLNFPHWREENVKLITHCLSLLKNHLHVLSVNELLVVQEVFQKIQEPADMLSEIQRCASKFLLQLEDEMSPQLDTRLKLFSCIIYFAPPSQRPHFKKIIKKYIDYNLNGLSLLELHKIIIFTKMSDNDICNKFWKKMIFCLKNKNFRDLHSLKVCQNYMNFCEEINGQGCPDFEESVLDYLEYELEHGLLGLLPSKFSMISPFLLVYSRNRHILDKVISKIEEFTPFFNIVDCINISRGFQNALYDNNRLNRNDIISIKESVEKCVVRCLQNNCDINTINLLIKSSIGINSVNKNLFYILNDAYRKKPILYSTHFKNTLYNLYSTNTLLPDVMNIIVDYVIEHKNDILGFNAERIVYLCYHLGFLPNNSEKFFQIVTDILLRDRERMSGLSYLQACLALCFFQNLSQSFTRQVFNVEFLEKLDVELANCYFKDVYPLRVRYSMMQLNRAVCLDYPESNVPWFHQKYINEYQEKDYKYSEKDYTIFSSIKEYLLFLIKNEDYIKERETAPYGYTIDFTINLDANNQFTNEINSTQRIAILVIKPHFYTNVYKQLKGFYQMKMRHLEILGYKIKLLDVLEWKDLISTEDKINFLINIIKRDEIYSNLLQMLKKDNKSLH